MSDSTQVYWVEEVARGLRFPFSIVWLPDGDALVTERQGDLRLLHKDVLEPAPLIGVPKNFQNAFNGLKDVLLDPDYQTNRNIFLLISEGDFERHHTAVYRAHYSRSGLTQVERIFRARDEMGGVAHSSARMTFLPDKTLLVAVPENHFHKEMAQRLDSHIGKMVRINREGSVPSDNPFLKTPGALPEIWSYGHRVCTGLYWDTQTGSMWEVEPGPMGGDELNILKAGGNFGWAKASWGFDYSGGLVTPVKFGAGLEDPILLWTPSVTPSGIARYSGKAYPSWNGDFFIGHLSGKALERLRIRDGRVVLQERMLLDLEERIRDVQVGPDERIYVLTDHQNGRILRLQPGRARTDQAKRVAHQLEKTVLARSFGDEGVADPVKGKQAFIDRCSGCHSVGAAIQGGNIGPDLAGVYGRRVGTGRGFNYSSAMAGTSFAWSLLYLDMFLSDPSGLFKGTTMSAPPVTEPKVRREIIEFLKQKSP